MDIKDIIESLTEEDIVNFMESLGAELSSRSNSNELIFTTICHKSDSYKLYYYIESHSFYCWSNCHKIGNILDLLIHINGYEIKDAINEVKSFFNIGNNITLKKGFRHRKKKFKKLSIDDIEIELLPTPDYKPYIHKSFKQIRLSEWEDEGISYNTLKKFDIRYDLYNEQIVIPHFCWNSKDRVVGVRIRNLNERKAEKYGKYCPLYYENNMYNHKLGNNLYGLNVTKDNIKKYKKCIILEGEKGVLQMEDMYPGTNISVALCGSSMSLMQSKILLELGIKECLFCMDKQYKTIEEMEIWKTKVFKLALELVRNGVECYLLLDDIEGLTEYRDAPSDKGIEIFKELVRNKIKIEGDSNDKL